MGISVRHWIAGSRPMTLPLGVGAVALGISCSIPLMDHATHYVLLFISLCLLIAVALQVGVNFANDYSDGIKGTDAIRRGPLRLVGSGLVEPKKVLYAAIGSFAIAAFVGIVIVVLTGYWWLLILGAICITAAWFYTGGKRPYGYYPLGEIAVFLFFGLVPTVGTTYVLTGVVSLGAVVAGAAAGLLSAAVLLTNNLRDRTSDKKHNKRTLVTYIGSTAGRVLYTLCMVLPYAGLIYFVSYTPLALLVLGLLPLATVPVVTLVWSSRTPPEWILGLKRTLLTVVLFEFALAIAITYS